MVYRAFAGQCRHIHWLNGIPLVFLALLIGALCSSQSAFAQTISPQKEALLAQKGKLLKEIDGYEQKRAEARTTLAQATSLRDMAKGANQVNQANIYAEAVGMSQKTVDTAEKSISEDRERLDAINHALAWEDSVVPRAVPTLVRGHITVTTHYGNFSLDPTKPVELGEHVLVGGDGFLEMQLEDGSRMHLGPNTDFLYERDVKGVYYQIFRGVLHKITIMGVRGSNDEATYRGLHTVGAVRGTDFTLEVKDAQDLFTVLEGEIEVDPGAGRKKISLKAGQQLSVSQSGPTGSPVRFDTNALARWWER